MSLLSIEDISDSDIADILERAAYFATHPKGNILSNKLILNLFFEPSTRTGASFEIAAKRQGAEMVSLSVQTSSQNKGETDLDTARTLAAMQPDCVVIRHAAADAMARFQNIFACPLVNAGDGTNQHPTQALLDAFTLQRAWGNLRGRKIVICGDIIHSRVARSNAQILSRLGAEVLLCGPSDFLPGDWHFATSTDFDAAINGVDAIMMLRIQHERQASQRDFDLARYKAGYCLTSRRLSKTKTDTLVMHPGPLNRGVEIMDSVADGAQSVILKQVANGIPVRQAVLQWVFG